MEHQTFGGLDDRPMDPAYHIEDCRISNLNMGPPYTLHGQTLLAGITDYIMTKSAPVRVYAVQQFLFAFGLHKVTLYRTAKSNYYVLCFHKL